MTNQFSYSLPSYEGQGGTLFRASDFTSMSVISTLATIGTAAFGPVDATLFPGPKKRALFGLSGQTLDNLGWIDILNHRTILGSPGALLPDPYLESITFTDTPWSGRAEWPKEGHLLRRPKVVRFLLVEVHGGSFGSYSELIPGSLDIGNHAGSTGRIEAWNSLFHSVGNRLKCSSVIAESAISSFALYNYNQIQYLWQYSDPYELHFSHILGTPSKRNVEDGFLYGSGNPTELDGQFADAMLTAGGFFQWLIPSSLCERPFVDADILNILVYGVLSGPKTYYDITHAAGGVEDGTFALDGTWPWYVGKRLPLTIRKTRDFAAFKQRQPDFYNHKTVVFWDASPVDPSEYSFETSPPFENKPNAITSPDPHLDCPLTWYSNVDPGVVTQVTTCVPSSGPITVATVEYNLPEVQATAKTQLQGYVAEHITYGMTFYGDLDYNSFCSLTSVSGAVVKATTATFSMTGTTVDLLASIIASHFNLTLPTS